MTWTLSHTDMSFTKLEECTLVFQPHPSAVVTESLLPVLAAMLPSDNRTLTLLSTCTGAHSFTDKLFWNLVQGRGRILVLVRNTAGFVPGALVEDAFVDSGTYTHGRDTNFILTLGATTGVPVKLLMTDPSDEYGVCMCSQWDVDSICVLMPGLRSASPRYLTVAPGYQQVVVNETLLAGSMYWSPGIIEVNLWS